MFEYSRLLSNKMNPFHVDSAGLMVGRIRRATDAYVTKQQLEQSSLTRQYHQAFK